MVFQYLILSFYNFIGRKCLFLIRAVVILPFDINLNPKRISLYGNIIYKVVDNSGNVTATKIVAVDGCSIENKKRNQLILINPETEDMLIPSTVNIDGIDYTAKAGQTVPVTAIVVNQNEEKVSDLSPEMIVSTTPTRKQF